MFVTRSKSCGRRYRSPHPTQNHAGGASAPAPTIRARQSPAFRWGLQPLRFGVTTHRASRLGREFTGLMTVREDVGALFWRRWWGLSRGESVMSVLSVSLSQGAKSVTLLRCRFRRHPPQRFQKKNDATAPGASATNGCSGRCWWHANAAHGKRRRARTHQALRSGAGQGVGQGWRCFSFWWVLRQIGL